MLWRQNSRLPTVLRSTFNAEHRTYRQIRRRSALSLKSSSVSDILSLTPQITGQDVIVAGSVRTIRDQKQRSFLELGDGSTSRSLQAVLSPSQAEGLTTGTFVRVRGAWITSPAGKEQSGEIRAVSVTILGATDAKNYPLQKKYHSPEYLRTMPHLRLRTPFNALLSRMRSESDYLIANFLRSRGFIRLQPPLITSSDCEGAGEVFTVSANSSASDQHLDKSVPKHQQEEFFGSQKYLTVSSQLHLEAFVSEHQKVWTLSPTFRAEKSDTSRHVSEFWMLEAEFRTESLDEVMKLLEELIQYWTMHIYSSDFIKELWQASQEHKDDPQEYSDFYEELIHRRNKILIPFWPRINYQDAIEKLKAAVEADVVTFQFEPSFANGLQLEHEKYLVASIGGGGPIFITHYPVALKPFYMLPSPSDQDDSSPNAGTVACFDVLMPGIGETAGGSLREHRLPNLIEKMRSKGLRVDSIDQDTQAENTSNKGKMASRGDLDWYVDLRRFGSVPHGGFGIGFDRILCYLAGVGNIKDVVPWPRWHKRCEC